MRPIIIDMEEMSDSREVYGSKPNPLLPGLIYLLLIMIVVAFVWMIFLKIDIVINAIGTVSAVEEVVTVTNQVSGTITERMIEDGQIVKKGAVLYTVSHDESTLLLEAAEKQLRDCAEKEEMLQAYADWLDEGTEFPKDLSDNLYYNEIFSRKLLVELGKQRTEQAFAEELSGYDARMDANTVMTEYYNTAISKSRSLIEAIRNRNNPFGSEDIYYQSFMENYLVQYQNMTLQYNMSIERLKRESNTAEQMIEKLEAEKQTLQNRLWSGEISVSGSDTEQIYVAQTEQQIQNLAEQILDQKALKETADSSINDYTAQKNSALNTYEKETITAVENGILSYEQNLAACEGTQQEYTSGQSMLLAQGTKVELENLVAQEKHGVAMELETCRQSRIQLMQQIESLNQNIENSTVRASIDGTVNFTADLAEGSYIGAGIQALSIIPNSETGVFSVRSYVENKDIAKIHEGMDVTYEIAAYPSREYGTMRGKVTFVSADLKVHNNGSACYVVETSVGADRLYNLKGEEAALKVGMLCETKIVIERKSVLTVLLEKLFHIGK